MTAVFKHIVKVRFYILYTTCFVHISCALKMEIQTPVIQINRSHSGRVVIRDENLRMDKSRRILIDLNPGLNQLFIKGLRHSKSVWLVRNVRHDNDDFIPLFATRASVFVISLSRIRYGVIICTYFFA